AGSRLASSGSSSSQIVVCGSVSRSTVASNAHGGSRITTVSFNHKPDLADRRYRRSQLLLAVTSSGASRASGSTATAKGRLVSPRDEIRKSDSDVAKALRAIESVFGPVEI